MVEGTRSVRTTNVSSRIPAATPMPISRIAPVVEILNTTNVPARMRPAEVIVVPVALTARGDGLCQ